MTDPLLAGAFSYAGNFLIRPAYALRQLLQFIPTIVGVTADFFLASCNVLPGNAALMAGGPQETNVSMPPTSS